MRLSAKALALLPIGSIVAPFRGFICTIVVPFWGFIGSIVVPFWGSYVGSFQVIPKRNYFGAYG